MFPYYLALGMSAEEYWNGNPTLPIYYRAKKELENDEANQKLWLQGWYNFVAVSTALGNAFRDKGKKPSEYLKEPINLHEETEEEKAQKKQVAIFERLEQMGKAFNETHKGK